MRILVPIAVLIFVICVACDDDKETKHELVIKTGRECGWCGGADSLVITKSISHYIFDHGCDDAEDKEVEEETSDKNWHELLSSLNWNEFTQVNVNTCALCADGCDTWIWIQNNDSIHQIRFTENSPEIASIQTFVEKLHELHAEFK